MSHWYGKKYTFKLNEQHEGYKKIIDALNKQINTHYNNVPGESIGANIHMADGKIIYQYALYKTSYGDITDEVIKLIEENINSNPDVYYYFQEDNGENVGVIEKTYGYAKKVLTYLTDAQYADNNGIYNRNHIAKFHECLNNPQFLQEIINEGEKTRYLHAMENYYDKTHVIHRMKNDKSDNKCFYQGDNIEEKWLAYFLAHGTNIKLLAKTDLYNTRLANLKEFLYINDNYLNEEESNSKWGAYALQLLTQQGVTFSEEPDNIEPPIYKKNGLKITKQEVEDWYCANKAEFRTTPVFSEETITFLQDKFPATLQQLKIKLEQLNETSLKSKHPKRNP